MCCSNKARRRRSISTPSLTAQSGKLSPMTQVKPPPLPPRPKDGHKGLFGRVLVVGGQDNMIGAPVLAGTAALRTGSGLVQIAMPREVLPFGLSITPELIGLALARGTLRRL